MLSPEALDIYQTFVLLDEFGIKPWELNDDGEVYQDDLTNMLALKRMKNEAAQREYAKQQAHASLGR